MKKKEELEEKIEEEEKVEKRGQEAPQQ